MSYRERFSGLAVLIALSLGLTMSVSPVPISAESITTRYGGKLEIDPAKFRIYDIPHEHFEDATGLPPSIQAPPVPLGQMKAQAPMATGRVLTLLVDWVVQAGIMSTAQFNNLLYSDEAYATGSVNDFYQEVSYGAFGITGDARGWYRMPGTNTSDYDIDAIVNAADPFVNFADYDYDNDGFVDALWLIHSGPGQEETHSPSDIWSHAYPPGSVNVLTDDGVKINGWSMCPELHLGDEIISIRVFCHEYGHILGLPDLYDYDLKLDTVTYFTYNDWNDHPVNGDWCVMGYNGYNIMSYGNRDVPSHFCGWARTFLGWSTPVVPACVQGEYQLYNIEGNSTQNLFKVPISDDGTEYFLLEYRNAPPGVKFDRLDMDYSAYNPWFSYGRNPLDSGLLITHIDESVYPNDGSPWWPNYGVQVVDAGYDPAHPWDGSEYTEWWYPYEFGHSAAYSPYDAGQTIFNATSTPNSDGYDGPSGVSIIVTGQNPDYMTIIIDKELAPEIQPIAPVDVVINDSMDVGIIATDPNCTTPGLSPGSLPSFVVMWDSGGGHGSLIVEPTEADLGTWYATVRATDGANQDSAIVQINVIPPPCVCTCHADLDCNGTTTVIDVVEVIDRAFRNGTPTNDAGCPPHGTTVDGRTDVDCSGVTTVVDLVLTIDVAFRNGDPAAKFCDPCL